MKIKEVITKMKNTYQIPEKQTVLQHGLSVRHHLNRIIKHIENKEHLKETFIPSWLKDFPLQDLSMLDIKRTRRYSLWHDLGKPFCQIKGPDN